ncbi:conserved hypothetical protein [Talaromyces marneffei ATCC 18224]|uniref:HTH CENPB-type domain-containing protein n=1 Tax=Talaromyces marneffei (strain ATCC 18224 / CBS 334.59 / QM 7333) TaxID=441960 RepID=B6Q2R5_TALMQ|nr:conserved hypothetical protein [Talaromyces marneffei ATCC 18224]
MKGVQYRQITRANHHKLTQSEEDSLVKWVLDLDRRGLPPRHSLVREMVNYLLLQHGKPQVGKNWVTNLIKRRPEIDSKFARKYNYERAKCEDPKIIQEHFDRVRDAISEYGILPEDIYNFDETGFAMGLCATAKVITGSDRYARPKLLQPGNREWVTAIEATNSTGWAIPSYIIFKAKKNVEQRMRDGFNHIDKLDFLMAFPQARTVAYKARTIQNSFVATGLVPFNPDRVIQQLNIRLKTPTPPPSRSSNTQSSCLQTPQNIRQFVRQTTTIKRRISERTGSPNQVIDQAIMRISKAYEITMNDLVLVRKEMHDLRAANEKEKQKRQKSKKQISIEQGITREEVQALVQGQIEASQAVTTAPAELGLPAPQAVVRRQFRCSSCGVEGHRINRCPSRTSS